MRRKRQKEWVHRLEDGKVLQKKRRDQYRELAEEAIGSAFRLKT